jgi:hypothetical protein
LLLATATGYISIYKFIYSKTYFITVQKINCNAIYGCGGNCGFPVLLETGAAPDGGYYMYL